MSTGYELLKETAKDYKQFRKSKLQPAIMKVLDCSYTEAYELGKTHCNLISTWLLLFCYGYITMDYADFFRYCLNKKFVKTNGYMYITKEKLFEELKLDIKITNFNEFPETNESDKKYQVAINKKGHFIAAGTDEEGVIRAFCTHDRLYEGEISEALKDDTLTWIREWS